MTTLYPNYRQSINTEVIQLQRTSHVKLPYLRLLISRWFQLLPSLEELLGKVVSLGCLSQVGLDVVVYLID